MAANYQRLRLHLEALRENEWRATFDQIEEVIGVDLPPSARKYPAWWSNTNSHSQALAWMNAGWSTCGVSLATRSVTFERESRDSLPDVEGKRRDWQKRKMGERSSNSDSTVHPPLQPTPADVRGLVLLGQPFVWVARIQPETRRDGTPCTDMPQKRYAKAAQKRLNPHGAGPFCKFEVRGLSDTSGIYAVTLNREPVPVYVGIAKESLKQRWGPQGYSRISPANCYVGGQSTNCKVNQAILQAVRQKQAVDLWIHEMEKPRTLERRLICKLGPLWNNQG